METPVAFSLLVELSGPDDDLLYSGEAIYRPARAHPTTGESLPMVGVPDAALDRRPVSNGAYSLRTRGEAFRVQSVYLERVSTCWWFVLDRRIPGVPRV